MRRFWVQVHLWLGLTLSTIGVAIGLSGAALVYDHEFDAWLNPQRYAITGPQAALSIGEYSEAVRQATAGKARPLFIRLPEEPGLPVVANARGRDAGGTFTRVFLDPPTGKVLDTVPGGGFIGWLHRFHGNLTLREHGGREIVGAVGIAMLISSLTGLYLWWPPRGRFQEALGPRAGLKLARNLHYLVGFYGMAFLALLSFTGIWLAFADDGRAVVAAFSPVSPRSVQLPEPRAEGAKIIPVDEVVKSARALHPSSELAGVGFPAGPRGAFRVNLISPRGPISVFLDPSSGAVLRDADPASAGAGDHFLALQRGLHTGDAFGAWRLLLFLAGLMPAWLVVTGTLMWLRQRRVG